MSIMMVLYIYKLLLVRVIKITERRHNVYVSFEEYTNRIC